MARLARFEDHRFVGTRDDMCVYDCGKGISAAFVMAEIKGIFESLTQTIDTPKEVLVKANQILKRTLERKTFISAAFGLLDTKTEEMTIARAGHCPIILLRDNEVVDVRPAGIGLGLHFGEIFEKSIEEIKIKLKADDTIVLYTDGITEAKNVAQEDFGDGHFEKALLESNDQDANGIANKVMREITEFTKDNSQHDDITLVILKWKQKK